MKKIFFILLLCANTTVCAKSQSLNVTITGNDAQSLYQFLNVEQEGAAGHIYKHGKNVECIRVNADMDDNQGKPIPAEDPRRYTCKMIFDPSGAAE